MPLPYYLLAPHPMLLSSFLSPHPLIGALTICARFPSRLEPAFLWTTRISFFFDLLAHSMFPPHFFAIPCFVLQLAL